MVDDNPTFEKQDYKYQHYYRMLSELALLSSQASMLDLGVVRDNIRTAEYHLSKYIEKLKESNK